MKEVTPRVYVVGSMHVEEGMYEYLKDIGIPEWTTDASSDGDYLIEVGGRVCYRSWQPYDPRLPDATNPNVDQVRAGNRPYIGNILKQGHGSVFEHANIAVIFRDVSRVFTHELVRHRAGFGYSQESLRFVRLDRLNFWIPPSLKEFGPGPVEWFKARIEDMEVTQQFFANMVNIKDEKKFSLKKKLTSMMRRLAPMGLATTIMATGNARAWRHVINMRSAAGAEEEMRVVMDQLVPMLIKFCPAAFQDVVRDEADGSWHVTYPKV